MPLLWQGRDSRPVNAWPEVRPEISGWSGVQSRQVAKKRRSEVTLPEVAEVLTDTKGDG